MTNSVPDRWLEYKAFGGVIKDTKILAFKVPLKDAIARNLKPEQRFTTTTLRQAFPHLKCIIDLTNTYRYYDKQEFTSVGIKYEKIAMQGRQIPRMDIIEKFFKVMDDFTSTCGEGDLVGVHCTHGVNRTGYMICRYLIQQENWEIQDSLKAFREARGYAIERDIYLGALREIQRGKRIDTSKIILMPTKHNDYTIPSRRARLPLKNSSTRGKPFSMSPPRHRFAPQRLAHCAGVSLTFGRPSWPMLPIPPPHIGQSSYGQHGQHGQHGQFRYGAPPIYGFPHPSSFPSRVPGPSRMPGPPRLPSGSLARLPPSKLPPTLLPPQSLPSPLPSSRIAKQHQQKNQHFGNGMDRTTNIHSWSDRSNNKPLPRRHREQDFTVDTFEENLSTSTSAHSQWKRQFHQSK